MTPEVGFYPYTKAVLILFFFSDIPLCRQEESQSEKIPGFICKKCDGPGVFIINKCHKKDLYFCENIILFGER